MDENKEKTNIPPVDDDKKGKVTPPDEEEKVSVPKSLLESILRKQEELEAGRIEDNKKIDQLQYAADKARMGIWDQRNAAGELIRTFGVGIWKMKNEDTGEMIDHIIRGTKMVFDDVVIEDNGGVRRLVEYQTLKVYLDDGLEEKTGKEKPLLEVEMPYVNFHRLLNRKRFPVVRESKTENGEFRTLRLDDGREIEFDIKFLNF